MEIIQTKEGSLDELLSVNDSPLTAGQKQEENRRIQKLISSPGEQRKLERERNEDAAQSRRLLQMLPDAFVFSYADQGDLIKLNFRPNVNFHPLSREARVFHAMEGEMWIDHKHQRLAEITGHLVQDVKFGGGVLGHLDKGGQFEVKQAEVAPGHWDITVLNVDMKGKALFFKTIGVHEKEYRSNFRRVADDLTPAQAADILSREIEAARELKRLLPSLRLVMFTTFNTPGLTDEALFAGVSAVVSKSEPAGLVGEIQALLEPVS
jgi:DNA-binding NarL/FixJ family response regulator